jgi:hypothetical protein
MKQVFYTLLVGGLLLPSLAQAQTARLQIIHNSADAIADPVDIYVNGVLAHDNVAFRSATSFADVPAGVNLNVGIAPGTSMSVNDTIVNFPVTFTSGETYVVVADGIVSSTGYSLPNSFDLSVYVMGREVSTNSANTDVLVHHGATDAPTVDVYETGIGAGLIVDDLAYGEFQGYLELPTADYTLEVRDETGATTVASYSAPLSTLSLGGQALVVVASGFLDPSNNSGGAAFGLYVALPAGGALVQLPAITGTTARLQIIHNSADAIADPVDIYVNGGLLYDDVAFRSATAFGYVPAGVTLNVGIAPGNSMSVNDTIANFPFTLATNETYIVVADGIVSSTGYTLPSSFGLEVYAMGREAATNAANTDVLVHHGATDAPTVDIYEVTAGELVDDLMYTDFAGYLELPTADYTLEVRDETGMTTVASFDAPLSTLNLDGEALVVLASGFLDPSANSNGAAFGLYVALPSGGALIALPAAQPTSITEDEVSINYYPNPSNGIVNFDDISLSTYAVTITDMTGRVVESNNYSVQNNSLNIQNLTNGFYQITLVKNETITSLRILKK